MSEQLTVFAALSKSSIPIIFNPLPSISALAFFWLLPKIMSYSVDKCGKEVS